MSHILQLDPQVQQFIQSFVSFREGTKNLTLDESRKISSEFFSVPLAEREAVHEIIDETVPGPYGPIPIRLYIPKGIGPFPVMTFYHRGGWVFGSIEESDAVCRKICNRSRMVIASVGYCLSPENPFPKPFEECYAAAQWVVENCSTFSGNPDKVGVAGESCGGNLAAAVALKARDESSCKLAFQALIYPILTSHLEEEPYRTSADQLFLTLDSMKWFWSCYVQDPAHNNDPYASPLHAKNFKNLPPALIITAEHDPLKHEAIKYGEKLAEAGIVVVTRQYPSVIHGFLDLPLECKVAEGALNEIGDLIGRIA